MFLRLDLLTIESEFMVTENKPLQLPKAPSPMLVTLLGIATEVKPVQREKALPPMLVTLLGIVTEVKPVQLKKALFPMLDTPLPIVTEVKPVQSIANRHRGQTGAITKSILSNAGDAIADDIFLYLRAKYAS